MSTELFAKTHQALLESDFDRKQAAAHALQTAWEAGELSMERAIELPDVQVAGRPERPELVPPRELSRRKLNSVEGQAAMLHAIAHIEFNAINLALDAVQRFRQMPEAYYSDWLRVAAEEAYHFSLMRERLLALGFDYGDFPAHNGLWELAVKTAADPLERMALVPRVMEARGLDVTPGIIQRFQQIGDQASVDCLRIIQRDEIGHVAAGTRWFHYLCGQRGLEPEQTYFDLLASRFPEGVRCPMDEQARLDAGFSAGELARLRGLCRQHAQS